MNQEDLIVQTKRLIQRVNEDNAYGMYAEVREFFRIYGGPKNSFLASLEQQDPLKRYSPDDDIRSLLESFLDYLEAGLHAEISPERRAQLDVVSDYLEMANTLLETKEVHPAAPAMIIGATLEEFLRTWIEAEGINLNNNKPSITSYSQILRSEGLITKQDSKDIIAWAGVRNHAAHGEWDEVADKKRVILMLEGVNLFMRKYSHL
jgi:hypothetical protein